MFKLLLILILFFPLCSPVYSEIKGRLEYHIPIDYSKLSESELENKAGFYYNLALKTSNGNINEDITTALNLYTILSNKNPNNVIYKIRLGTLYDLIGKDKYAKGYFYQAIGTNPNIPEPYYKLGEFFYKRTLYKRAINMYKEAYKQGYNSHYETLYRIGEIYEKFGDTEAALKYLNLAKEQSPNEKLDNKILKLENANSTNREYYSNTRIRLIEK